MVNTRRNSDIASQRSGRLPGISKAIHAPRPGASARVTPKASTKQTDLQRREATSTKATKEPPAQHREARSRAAQLGNHILFLFVGEQRELVTVHSNLLPQVTQAYLTERFADDQMCWLREESPEIVDLYRLFLYTGKLFSNDEKADQIKRDNGRSESHEDAEWTKLAHCYYFAVMIKDESFANACITSLIEKVNATERFPTGIATEVYGYTRPGDKLRCLIVDLHVWLGRGSCIRPPHEDASAPPEFLQDVISELAAGGAKVHEEGERLWETDGCAYHKHEATARCGIKANR